MESTRSRVPFRVLFAYAFGQVGIGLVDRAVVTWVMIYYVSSEGARNPALVAPMLFGAAMLIGRASDAIMDPLVAFWTDRCRSPWGRRIPFLVIGGIGLPISTALVYFPAGEPFSLTAELYLIGILATFFTFFTIYVAPYLALFPELARSDRDRINLSTLKSLFNMAGVIIGMIGTGKMIALYGYKGMALLCAGFSFLSFMVPVLFVREHIHCQGTPSALPLATSVKETLTNRAFRAFVATIVACWFGFNMVSSAVPYYVVELLGKKEEFASTLLAVTFAVAIACFPVVNLLGKRLGKHRVLMICLVTLSVQMPLIYFIGHPLNPIPPLLFIYLVLGLVGLPVAILFIIPDTLIAELTDVDARITGQRREAMFFGVQGLIMKTSIGLSAYFMSFLFERFGYQGENVLGLRLTGPAAGLFAFFGLLVFCFYPRLLELEAKRGDLLTRMREAGGEAQGAAPR